jgi:diketogulonate reductase-like aldo/keto reductase
LSIPDSRIIYGTAWKKEATAALVELALRQGFRGIDTACQPKHYNEAGVGEGVAACLGDELTRADLYLQTKFTPISGQDPARVPYDQNATLSEQVLQSAAVSLKNLQTTYLDCLVVHSPLSSDRKTLEVWRAMESLVASGSVRQIGISNCYELQSLQALHRSAQIKPRVVQNRFYERTGYDREIRAFCQHNQITYQSFWTLTANPHILADPAITSLASSYGRTPAQILFRYLTQIGVVPLAGTRSKAHMREDLAIFEFELAESERAEVDALIGDQRA